MRIVSFIIAIALFSACNPVKEKGTGTFERDTSYLRYATCFRISSNGKIKQIEVTKPFQGATTGQTYWLVPSEEEVPPHAENIRIIRTPINTIVCTSTTHIPLLDYLDESKSLVGFPTPDYISSEKTRAFIDAGKIQDVGIDKGLNIELLATLHPTVVMAYTMSGDFGQFKKIESLGIPVVLNAEYLEEHPLGRAEWIKFMGLLYNKERLADSVFSVIEKNYLATKAMVESTTPTHHTVMSGIVYGDAWFMPAGRNYAAKILRDAGYDYLWSSDTTTGFLQLSFESVFEKANQSEYWIGVGSYKTLDEIKKADHRYTQFQAFKTKQVYTYDGRLGAKGGSEFLELGYLRPDLILNDLVKIAYPELLPDHTLFFHKKLE